MERIVCKRYGTIVLNQGIKKFFDQSWGCSGPEHAERQSTVTSVISIQILCKCVHLCIFICTNMWFNSFCPAQCFSPSRIFAKCECVTNECMALSALDKFCAVWMFFIIQSYVTYWWRCERVCEEMLRCICDCWYLWVALSLSALTLLVAPQEEHLVCKSRVMRCVGMVIYQ